jgi:hypothetical protein
MKPRVFVVQDTQRMVNGRLEAKFDLSSAEKYGRLIYMLSPSARPFQSEHVIGQLKEHLGSYDFYGDDCLLLIGNPALIGFACAIAAERSVGKLRLLQWDGKAGSYIPIVADLRFLPF